MILHYVTDFIQYLKFEKRYSQHTIIAYQKDLLQFSEFAQEQFGELSDTSITHFHVRTWLATLKDTGQIARTLNRKLSSLNSYYKYLLRQGHAKKNPVTLLHSQKLPERLPTYVKEQEVDLLLEEIQFDEGFKGLTDRLICVMLYATGLRRSELLNLKESNIEWSLKQIRVLGKGNKERLIPIGAELQDLIKIYLGEKKKIQDADYEHLLVLESGKQLYAGYVYKVVKSYLSTVTSLKKRSPHVLRHSFATHLLNNGANIQAIKDLLGHSSLAATQVYTHNNIDRLKEIYKTSHPRG